MQDRFYFGTNTKMFKTAAETVDYLRRLEELTHGIPPERAQRCAIPSYTSLGPARAELDRAGSGILLGAQNMGWEERGQYTGEISPLMLREAGARLVMVGHSERRHTFRETDAEEGKEGPLRAGPRLPRSSVCGGTAGGPAVRHRRRGAARPAEDRAPPGAPGGGGPRVGRLRARLGHRRERDPGGRGVRGGKAPHAARDDGGALSGRRKPPSRCSYTAGASTRKTPWRSAAAKRSTACSSAAARGTRSVSRTSCARSWRPPPERKREGYDENRDWLRPKRG